MRKLILIFTVIFLIFTGCREKGSYLSHDIYAMSTVISVNIPKETENSKELISATEEYIYSLEKLFSATDEKSEISLFNQCSRSYDLSDDIINVLATALDVAKNTNGAYDPTCLSLTELWNISDGGYLPTESELNDALEKVNYSLLTLDSGSLTKSDPDIKLDLGGVAKGYALQKCVEMLSQDTDYGMISFGGNVGVWGEKPNGSLWEIGIKDPFDTNNVIGYFKISEGYVSVSGDYERFFEKDGVKYHHIFNTENGYPVDNGIHSVAVFTKDGALGDALSTALFAMGYEEALALYESKIYNFEALFVTDNGLYMTEGAREFFTEK